LRDENFDKNDEIVNSQLIKYLRFFCDRNYGTKMKKKHPTKNSDAYTRF